MKTSNHIGKQHYRMATKFIVSATLLLIACSRQTQSKPTSIEQQQQQQQQVGGEEQIQVGDLPNSQNMDSIRRIHYHFEQKMDPLMKLHKFNSTDENSNTVTCNDGSPIGYYKRLNVHSKSWIIYLQGGGYCGGEEACQHRWRHSPQLMSSNYWPPYKSVDGILSSESKDNPYLWNANHIYVPYCSSDSWTGLQEARADRSTPSFTFMGSKIIEKVLDSLFDDLPRESSLFESKFILLAGDSAGATGVILNLDKVNRLVQQRFNATSSISCTHDWPPICREQPMRPTPVLRGLADSGWFLDNEPFDYGASGSVQASFLEMQSSSGSSQASASGNSDIDCDRQRCSPLQSIKQAMLYWNGQVPMACANRHTNEPWRCYFAYRAQQTLKTPLFVVQWLYDEAQLMVDNIIRPVTIEQWNYVHRLVEDMRQSLENVTALFAPSCFAHSLIVRPSWNQVNINGFRLPHILNMWEEEVLSNQPNLDTLMNDQQQQQQQQVQPEMTSGSLLAAQQLFIGNQASLAADNFNRNEQSGGTLDERRFNQAQHSPLHFELRSASTGQRSATTNPRPKGRKKRRNNNNNNNNNNQQHHAATSGNRNPTLTNRLSRSTSIVDDSTLVFNNNVPDVLVISASKQQRDGTDKFRLIDTCGWPQCNRDCPFVDQDFNLRPILPY